MSQRNATEVAAAILELPADRVRRVTVDGVVGAGKTRFADDLGAELTSRGASVIRASAEGFLNPPKTRHRRGKHSPEGFYYDSFDYGRMVRLLLDPLGPDGSGVYVRKVYDLQREREAKSLPEIARPDAVLVMDGVFTLRRELVMFWDYSVWLEVPLSVGVARRARGDGRDPDPRTPQNRRYLDGQRLYLEECKPRERASIVIDNADLEPMVSA